MKMKLNLLSLMLLASFNAEASSVWYVQDTTFGSGYNLSGQLTVNDDLTGLASYDIKLSRIGDNSSVLDFVATSAVLGNGSYAQDNFYQMTNYNFVDANGVTQYGTQIQIVDQIQDYQATFNVSDFIAYDQDNGNFKYVRPDGLHDIDGSIAAIWGIRPDVIEDNHIASHTAISDTPPSAVPEPDVYAMMLAGLGLIGYSVRKRLNFSRDIGGSYA